MMVLVKGKGLMILVRERYLLLGVCPVVQCLVRGDLLCFQLLGYILG
jgi:hypothetical protein